MRKGMSYRQIEIFDLESEQFYPITELINPNIHHYNSFFSPGSGHLGYHRFRKESAKGDSIVHYLQPVASPLKGLRLLRVHGAFASFCPDGNLIAANCDFFSPPGLVTYRSDGSKRCILIQEPSSFYTAWNPRGKGVIYTSIGPIQVTVRIARITFDQADLDGPEEVPAAVTLLTRSGPGNDAFPSCSPDGKWLVFRSGRSGQKNFYILDAMNVETESGDGIRRLTEGERIDTMPAWSPDGELIAFSSNRHKPSNADAFSIYLVRPDGSDLHRVYVAGPEGSADVDRERINHVCFSPDSRWLLFTCNFGSVTGYPVPMPARVPALRDFYTCRPDGTGLQRLTCNAYETGMPAGSPTWVRSRCGPPPRQPGRSYQVGSRRRSG